MRVLDVDNLLLEVTSDKPCGDNLEYDPLFAEMERLSRPKPEQQFGDTTVPAEEPDWRAVKSHALELLSRTSDLRIVSRLGLATTHVDGIPGLRDVLAVLAGLLDRRWEHLHPALDPDDGNDPTMRVNAILALCDAETMLAALRRAPLCRSRTFGNFSLGDIERASNGAELAGEDPEAARGPDLKTIDAAFLDSDASEVDSMATLLGEAIEFADGAEAALTSRIGAAQAPSLAPLRDVLESCRRAVDARRAMRDGGGGGDAAVSAGGESAAPAAGVGAIQSPADVVRALDAICAYYRRSEPSSPIPMLLERAKRLVAKDFAELLRDLASDGLKQFDLIRGIQEES